MNFRLRFYIFFKVIVFLLIAVTEASSQNCITCTSSYTTLTNGLVFCVPFNGANMNDQTSSGFPGTGVNGPVSVTDRLGNANGAFSFNGSNRFIRYGDILDSVFCRVGGAKFTISGWAKGIAPTGSNRSVIIGKSAGGVGPYQWYVYWDNDGKLTAATCSATNGPTDYIEQKSPAIVPNNTWFHFVYIFDGSLPQLSRCKLYVNGVIGNGLTPVGNLGITTNNTAQELTVGASHVSGAPNTPANPFNGSVDDLRIYNRALTAAEVSELYNGTPLQITPMPDVGVCLGDSVKLTASPGATTYQWTPSNDLSSTTVANVFSKPTATRTYRVIITQGSCTNTDTVVVTLNQNCCVKSSSIASKNSSLVYYVPVNNEARDVSTNPATVIVNGASTALTIDRFSNKNSSYTFNNVTNDKLVTPATTKLSFPATTSFTISAWVYPKGARSVASPMVNVYKNGGYELIYTSTASGADSGKVQFLDYEGATSTNKVLMLSDSALPINKWSLISVTVDKSDSSNKLYINDRLAASFKGESSVQNSCGVTIGNHNLNPLGFNGNIDEVRIYTTALSQNEIKDLYYQGKSLVLNPDTTICSGDTVQLRVWGNANSYSWSPSAGLSNPNIAEPIATPTTTTTYILTSTNGTCSFKDTVIVYVNFSNANAGLDSIICAGDSIRLIGSGGSKYLWTPSLELSNDTISNPYTKPTISRQYVLRATTSGCVSYDTVNVTINDVFAEAGSNVNLCYGDSIQLHGSGGTSYQWSPFATLSNYQDSIPFAKPLTTTTYRLIVSKGNCNQTDSVIVNVIKVTPDAGSDVQICPGDSIQINATGGTSYAWLQVPGISDTTLQSPFVKPATSTMFYVYAKIGSCSVVDSVKVNVQSTLTTFAGLDQTICRGNTVNLNATGGSNFIWSPNKWISDPNIANPVSTPDSTIEYVVTGISGNCTDTATVKVIVNQLPVVMAGNDTFACKGKPFQLMPIIINADVFTWTPAAYLDNPSSHYPNATINSKTEFKVVAQNSGTLCENADSIWLDVSSPNASFTVSSAMGDVPFKVATFNSSTPQPMTYLWSFYDSVNYFSVETNPYYTFEHPGVYMIVLEAKDVYGCSDFDTAYIQSNDGLRFFIPNAFSPNGDRFNPTFEPIYTKDLVKKVEGLIFNRWGGIVYEFTVPGDSWWDGTSNGKLAPEGVYIYTMKVTDINNRTKVYKGQVTLLR